MLSERVFYADDGNCEVEYDEEAWSREEAAEDYVDGGSWGDEGKSFGVSILTYRKDEDGDSIDVERHFIVRHPKEPECEGSTNGVHLWIAPQCIVDGLDQNPGVWATGGVGFKFRRVCGFCGLNRYEQTASQPDQTEYDHDILWFEPSSDEDYERLVTHWKEHEDIPLDMVDSDADILEDIYGGKEE